MQITLNGEEHMVEPQVSVEDLLRSLDIDPTGVAVAVNLQVVPRGAHGGHRLKSGDRVDVIRAVGGG